MEMDGGPMAGVFSHLFLGISMVRVNMLKRNYIVTFDGKSKQGWSSLL